MKLLRLKLNVPFRSLAAGFEIHFLREWDRDRFDEFHPYCLAGRNGSGKSNVLEALAAIFYHIECIYLDYRPDRFEANEFQLQISSFDSVGALPQEAHSLIVVARLGLSLRIRVFDSEGRIISDKIDAELIQNELDTLAKELGAGELPIVEDLERKRKKKIIRTALSCSGLAVPEGFSPDEATPDAFELEYLIQDNPAKRGNVIATYKGHLLAHIRVTKEEGERPVIRYSAAFNDSEAVGEELSRQEVKAYLPKYVLGYSSGHNEILSLPFFKMRFIHFDEYRDHLTKDLPYDGRPEGRLIYLDDQFSQAILLCHFLFPSDPVLRIFRERVQLTGIRRFRLIIRRHHRLPVAAERLQSMSPEDQNDRSKATVELTSKLYGHYDDQNQLQLGLIDKLIKCSTTFHEEESDTEADASDLYLDYWVNDATRRAFQVHFGTSVGGSEEASLAASALNLFQSLQTLLTLNHYQVSEQTKAELYHSDSLYVNETIPMPASDERIMRFKDFEITKDGVTDKLYSKALSDGEHQLVHTIGLCLLFRHESALFLLDEPETHLNPDWRAAYISTLRRALEADEPDEPHRAVLREVVFTSHSPFIISDCQRQSVLVFTKDPETREVTWTLPDFETFGASANAITMKVFGQTETIGDYAMQTITGLRDRLEAGGNPDELIEEADHGLGDSVEKLLFMNEAAHRKRPGAPDAV